MDGMGVPTGTWADTTKNKDMFKGQRRRKKKKVKKNPKNKIHWSQVGA